MRLKWKYKLYNVLRFVWALVALGGAIGAAYLLFSGYAEPYLSPPSIPRHQVPLFVIFAVAVLLLLGLWIFSILKSRVWWEIGRRANLSPEGKWVLTGEIRGRPVRVRTGTWKRSGGDSNPPATIVEAEMDEPAEEGFVIDTASSAKGSALSSTDSDLVYIDDGQLSVVGESEALARALLAGRSRKVLLDLDTIGILRVGRTSNFIDDSIGEVLESVFGEEAVETGIGGEASTVTHKVRGMVLDPNRLRRQVIAVTTVAGVLENEMAESQPT